VCANALRRKCDNRYHRPYAPLEIELFAILSQFDFERLLDRAPREQNEITAIESEIAAKNAILEEQAEGFDGRPPPAFL
jgi:hypothetical protein